MSGTRTAVEDRRDAQTLEAVERAHDEAERAWQAISAQRSQLERGNVLTTAGIDGRETRRKLDEVERTVRLSRLQDDEGEAASVLLDARHALREAKIATANATLQEQAEEWQAASRVTQMAKWQVESALASLLLAVHDFEAKRREEETAARSLYRVAAKTVEDDKERDRMRLDLAYDVPVAVTSEGVETVERPSPMIVGDADADPRSIRFWQGLGSLLALDPEKARRQIDGTALGELVAALELGKQANDGDEVTHDG
jgi:hypothetical protein